MILLRSFLFADDMSRIHSVVDADYKMGPTEELLKTAHVLLMDHFDAVSMMDVGKLLGSVSWILAHLGF